MPLEANLALAGVVDAGAVARAAARAGPMRAVVPSVAGVAKAGTVEARAVPRAVEGCHVNFNVCVCVKRQLNNKAVHAA